MIFNNQIFKTSKKKDYNLNNLNSDEYIKFIFYDLTSIEYEKNSILSLSKNLINNIQKSDNIYIIRVPYGITKEDFISFINIYLKIESNIFPRVILSNDIKRLFSLLKLMDFFGNEKKNCQIITKIIIPELNCDHAVELIIYSYDKLCYYSEKQKEANNAYFELFYQCLEELSSNENVIIKNIEKLKSLDGKIIEELIQKTFRKLIFGNYLIEKNDDSEHNETSEIKGNYLDDNEINSCDFYQWRRMNQINSEKNKKINIKNLKNLIMLLLSKNNLDNIFSLLTREYMYLLSSESIQELQNLPNPNFQTKIPLSLYENYYEEFPLDININNQLLTLVIYYKKSDKSINVCIKLSKNKKEKIKTSEENDNNKYCFEILTFLTSVKITKIHKDEKNIIEIQNNLTSLTNNKSMYSILKIPHFNLALKEEFINNKEKSEDYFLLTLRISLCDIYSVVASYLLHDYYKYSNDKDVSKLTKQLFILLLKNQNINKKSENNIVRSILLWLDDEINLKEDISEILYLIKWEDVDDELIFELLFKYSYFIFNDNSLENIFLDIYLNKFKQNNIRVKLIIQSLFKTIKKLEYYKLYGKIKKDEKIIENFLNKKRKKSNAKDKELIKKESIIYNDKCIQTDFFEENNNKSIENKSNDINKTENNLNKRKNNNTITNIKCDWNISKMKYFLSKNNNENKLTKRNKEKKIEKMNSCKTSKNKENNLEKERNKSKSKEKKENYKYNSSFQSSKLKIENNNKIENKNNISITKEKTSNKSKIKIKEMQIFPVNFSSLKKFKKIKKEKTNKKNEEEKDEKIRYYTANNSKKKNDKNYYSERNSEKSNKKKYISRIYSEKRIKISFGIIKEINFVNNL